MCTASSSAVRACAGSWSMTGTGPTWITVGAVDEPPEKIVPKMMMKNSGKNTEKPTDSQSR